MRAGLGRCGDKRRAILRQIEVQATLVEGQSARGLRTAISRAATSRGLSVVTLEGEGFVAVRTADETQT